MGHALPLSLMQKDGVRGGSGSSGLQQGRGGSGAKGHASVVVIDHEAEELIKRAQVGQGPPPPDTHTHTGTHRHTHTDTYIHTHTQNWKTLCLPRSLSLPWTTRAPEPEAVAAQRNEPAARSTLTINAPLVARAAPPSVLEKATGIPISKLTISEGVAN